MDGRPAQAQPLVLQGRCLPYGDGITYWPLAEILKGHAGILDTDPPELAVEKVRKAGHDLLTTAYAADPVRATAALAYTVGLEDPDVTFAGADAARRFATSSTRRGARSSRRCRRASRW